MTSLIVSPTAADLVAFTALGERALDIARTEGADWADIRVGRVDVENLVVRNGRVAAIDQGDEQGFGVRVMVDGAHGFASGFDLTPEEIERVTRLACRLARASRRAGPGRHRWADEPAHRDIWTSPLLLDPFKIPIEDKLAVLMAADEELRKDDRVKAATGRMGFLRESQVFLSSEGASIRQVTTRSGGGIAALASADGESQIRSYPCSFDGQYQQGGYEVVQAMDLAGHAAQVRDEAVELLSADDCPIGDHDIILSGDQLALQIHESVGHPTELDRVEGWEIDLAGNSFAVRDKLEGGFRYGSEQVNLVADATVPGGLATIGYDDDGVRSQRWHVVQDGIFKGYMTSREVAHFEAESGGSARSRGCSRGQGAWNVPIVRISNLSLMPGTWAFDDLVRDTEYGIYMDGVKSWSIDQQRLNFQFTCEYGYVIENGRRTKTVKNPTYQGMTPHFWASCDAVCGPDEWTLWGVINCGKGQPMQIAEMSHGAAPTRFRKQPVGVRT